MIALLTMIAQHQIEAPSNISITSFTMKDACMNMPRTVTSATGVAATVFATSAGFMGVASLEKASALRECLVLARDSVNLTA